MTTNEGQSVSDHSLSGRDSYEGAAALLRQLGHRADDATLHALAQTLGGRVEQQTQRRLKEPAIEQTPQRAASEVGVLMLDGWQVRQRGPGWGKKKTQQPRVAWHELKTGVFYLQEQAARKNGRGILSDKVVVSWQGEPMELGRRLRQAACEHGLGRARQKLVVSDGAPWIWNVAQDRWNGAVEVLDFYHASQHVWALGEAVHGEGERARGWVEKQLHQLRHGRHAAALRTIAGLKPGRGQAGEVIRREQNYFASHAARMNYRAVSAGRLRPGGISLFATSRSVQTQRPILDAARLAPLVCLDRSPPERSLGPTLESVTGGYLSNVPNLTALFCRLTPAGPRNYSPSLISARQIQTHLSPPERK